MTAPDAQNPTSGHHGRKLGVYDDVHFDPKLKPKNYEMKGKQPFMVNKNPF
jgi:hypothetical protein